MTTSIDSAGQRQRLDVALEELDVGDAGLGGIPLGEGEHLVGHVDAERATGRPDPLGRQQDVDAAARAEVEDPLAGMEVGHRGRVAAAEGREDRGIGQLVALERRVEVRPDGLGIAAARRALRCAHRRVGVVLCGRSRGWSRWSSLGAPRCGRTVMPVLILDDIDICQYIVRDEATDRSGRPAPAGRRRPHPTRDPAPAERRRPRSAPATSPRAATSASRPSRTTSRSSATRAGSRASGAAPGSGTRSAPRRSPGSASSPARSARRRCPPTSRRLPVLEARA